MNKGSLYKVPKRGKDLPPWQLFPNFGFGATVSHLRQFPGGEKAASPVGASLPPGYFPLWPENTYFL